jgi:hypothetical protein
LPAQSLSKQKTQYGYFDTEMRSQCHLVVTKNVWKYIYWLINELMIKRPARLIKVSTNKDNTKALDMEMPPPINYLKKFIRLYVGVF